MTRHDPAEETGLEASPATRAARRALHRERTRVEELRTQMERVARFNLAVCQDLNHNRTGALRSYERFVRRFPADARVFEAYFRMGVLARETQRLELAVESFRAVWQNEQATADYRAASIYQGGLCLEHLARADEARQVYSLVTQTTPPGDPYRLATLQRLAGLLRQHEPLRAMELYRELADYSGHAVDRAVAQQNLLLLQAGTAIATAH
jgi:TolA-binding protein